jgi:predicted dehydrogenase
MLLRILIQGLPNSNSSGVTMTHKIALVGLGHWGSNHLKALLRMKGEGLIEDIILCDAREEYGQNIADEHKIHFENNFDEIIKDESINAVDIVTPIEYHYEMVSKALKANKDVFVEKPITDTVSNGDSLIKLAKGKNRILMVGHVFRFHPAVKKLKEMITSGELGEIYSVDIQRQAIRIPRPDRGVLYELAIHDVDLGCYLLGEEKPERIVAFSQSFYSRYPDESAIILMNFSGKRIVKIESAWIDPVAHKTRTLKLIGSKKSAFIDFLRPNEIQIFERHIEGNGMEMKLVGEGCLTIPTEEGMPLDRELLHFLECLSTRKQPLADGIVGRNALLLVESAMKSVEQSKILHL